MKGGDILRQSVGNLTRRKVRTALTLIGVVIGVGALVLMVSLGIGLKNQLLGELQTEDLLRTLQVTRTDQDSEDDEMMGPGMMQANSKPVTLEDFDEIRKVPNVTSVTPQMNLFLHARVEKKGFPWMQIANVVPEEEAAFEKFITHGRLWEEGAQNEIILPSRFFRRSKKYKPEDLVDQPIILYKRKGDEHEIEFKVVGVVDSEELGMMGNQFFTSLDTAVRLRDETKGGLMSFGYEEGAYPSCEVRVGDARHVEDVKAALKKKGFTVFTISDLISFLNTVFLIIEGFLACIGAIGLIVALFGIANTMAMSVLERTREIGIMKALGARRKVVLKLFLLESAWIGALGGTVGLIGGWALGLLLNLVARGLFNIPDKVSLFHVSAWLAIGSVLFAVMVSLVAGVVPALRASRLDPVQALRHEA